MNHEQIIEYLKTLPSFYINNEHNRRLGASRSEPTSCPICKAPQASRLALRKHFRSCKMKHPGSTETLTGVIGEEKIMGKWEIVRCFDGSDLAGREWVAEGGRTERPRRFRRVQRGSKLWVKARKIEKQAKAEPVKRVPTVRVKARDIDDVNT